MRKITIFILLALLLVLGAAPAYAIPALPHAFYGSVTINGSVAANGTEVSATVDNGTVISTQNPVTTAAGSYGVDSTKLLVQGDITPGATITFYVNGVEAVGQTATFEAGGGPTERDLSVTIRRPAGGGGGGLIRRPPPGTTDVRGVVGTGCCFLEGTDTISEDGLCTLTIPEGTVGLTEELECLSEITMVIMDEPPPPPKDAHIIGLVYDFGPDGATFDPPAMLTFDYDPRDIPEGIAEQDLVLAYYDEVAGKWVELKGCVVDRTANTITAPFSHFTGFTIVGAPPPPPPAPAAFSVSNLSVQPIEVQPRDAVTITVSVANTGGTEESYSVVLKINRVKEAEKSVTVAAGKSQDVSFTVTREEAASYSVVVDGLSGSFTVAAPEVAVPAPPAPPAPSAPPAPMPPAKLPINWPVLGGIIAAIVVAALLIFFSVRRRAY